MRSQTATEMDRRYRDADFLRNRYVEAGQSASGIAEDCGVTRPNAVRPRNARVGVKRHASVTSSTVSRWLDRHGIERDSNYQDRAWLAQQYVDRGRLQQDIADDCGVTKSTISHWLSRHGITDGAS
ncbi:hypothetical protein EGH22_14020 [Halomicroarcula sp. F28]|uniref:hypothetical protein n=1 Tax=Haloarcula salinisoli TaxID=2487746 RepID=UPI001C739C3A|nr:hypothetical protein [Halomicroarcula salinisoli]MBX0287448.1 hypothetical protein [Halomicroarcula salinisoli]